MNYKSFRSQGLMIGSGPMEKLHINRHTDLVKRSGQEMDTPWCAGNAESLRL